MKSLPDRSVQGLALLLVLGLVLPRPALALRQAGLEESSSKEKFLTAIGAPPLQLPALTGLEEGPWRRWALRVLILILAGKELISPAVFPDGFWMPPVLAEVPAAGEEKDPKRRVRLPQIVKVSANRVDIKWDPAFLGDYFLILHRGQEENEPFKIWPFLGVVGQTNPAGLIRPLKPEPGLPPDLSREEELVIVVGSAEAVKRLAEGKDRFRLGKGQMPGIKMALLFIRQVVAPKKEMVIPVLLHWDLDDPYGNEVPIYAPKEDPAGQELKIQPGEIIDAGLEEADSLDSWGFSERTQRVLQGMGIRTQGDLLAQRQQNLQIHPKRAGTKRVVTPAVLYEIDQAVFDRGHWLPAASPEPAPEEVEGVIQVLQRLGPYEDRLKALVTVRGWLACQEVAPSVRGKAHDLIPALMGILRNPSLERIMQEHFSRNAVLNLLFFNRHEAFRPVVAQALEEGLPDLKRHVDQEWAREAFLELIQRELLPPQPLVDALVDRLAGASAGAPAVYWLGTEDRVRARGIAFLLELGGQERFRPAVVAALPVLKEQAHRNSDPSVQKKVEGFERRLRLEDPIDALALPSNAQSALLTLGIESVTQLLTQSLLEVEEQLGKKGIPLEVAQAVQEGLVAKRGKRLPLLPARGKAMVLVATDRLSAVSPQSEEFVRTLGRGGLTMALVPAEAAYEEAASLTAVYVEHTVARALWDLLPESALRKGLRIQILPDDPEELLNALQEAAGRSHREHLIVVLDRTRREGSFSLPRGCPVVFLLNPASAQGVNLEGFRAFLSQSRGRTDIVLDMAAAGIHRVEVEGRSYFESFV